MRLQRTKDLTNNGWALQLTGALSANPSSQPGAPFQLTRTLSPLASPPRSPRSPRASPLVTTSPRGSKVSRTLSPLASSPRGAPPKNPLQEPIEHVIKEGNSDEIDESAMNISAMAETLASGSEDQITLILFETQQVLEVCREYAVQALIPIICEQVTKWGASLQISAAEAFISLAGSKIPPILAKKMSDTSFKVIRSSKDPCVCEIWGQILVTTLPHVCWSPKELDEVVDQLESQQHGSDGLAVSRQLTARILGSLAMCSKDEELKKRIMYRAIYITNDKDVEVRGMIAESLSFIGAAIPVAVVEEELWPCIMRLIKDENARVHAASMRTLSFIAVSHRDKHPRAKLYRHLIPPVLMLECSKIRKAAEADQRTVDDDTYLVLEINAEIFGSLLHSCWEHMADDAVKKEAYKAFCAMATCNGPIVRKYCAFNLPGISQCFVRRHRIEMSGIAEFLSRDSDPETRWILAAGLHETVKILANKDTIGNLFKSVLSLLQDKNPLVRMSTLQHFEELIAQLAKHTGYNSTRKLEPIFQNLDLLSEGNWRTQELLSKQLLLAAPLVPPPSLRSNVLPLLYKLADESSYLVRKAAMAAVAACMRYIPDTTERNEEMSKFRDEWATGVVYWMRTAFIDCAEAALQTYSRCLFRDTFGAEVVRLASDPVPNVRIRVAQILPLIAPACHQMVEFQKALERLKADEDKDVGDTVRGIDENISQALSRGRDNFEQDMKREEEEQDLYTRHLQAQKEAFRKKKGPIKRAKTMLVRKSVKGGPAGSPKYGVGLSVPDGNLQKESKTNTDIASPKLGGASPLPLNASGTKSNQGPPQQRKKPRSRSFIVKRGNAAVAEASARGKEDDDKTPSSSPLKGLRATASPKQPGKLPKKASSFILKRS